MSIKLKPYKETKTIVVPVLLKENYHKSPRLGINFNYSAYRVGANVGFFSVLVLFLPSLATVAALGSSVKSS